MVGSSWNIADRNGLAPIRSPAATKMVWLVILAELVDQRRHVFAGLPPARHHDLFGLVVGIGDADAARRRAEVAVKIVDRENAQFDRCGGLGLAREGGSGEAGASGGEARNTKAKSFS